MDVPERASDSRASGGRGAGGCGKGLGVGRSYHVWAALAKWAIVLSERITWIFKWLGFIILYSKHLSWMLLRQTSGCERGS